MPKTMENPFEESNFTIPSLSPELTLQVLTGLGRHIMFIMKMNLVADDTFRENFENGLFCYQVEFNTTEMALNNLIVEKENQLKFLTTSTVCGVELALKDTSYEEYADYGYDEVEDLLTITKGFKHDDYGLETAEAVIVVQRLPQ